MLRVTAQESTHFNNQSMAILYLILSLSIVSSLANFGRECKIGLGRFYTGTKSITSSGKLCQDWDKLSANKTSLLYDHLFADGSRRRARNYCRYPFKEDDLSRPWCYYAVDGGVQREECNITDCDQDRCTAVPSAVDYFGQINRTLSGEPCANWSSLPKKIIEYFKLYGVEENYCRNPTPLAYPFCYTEDEWFREYCDIPVCEEKYLMFNSKDWTNPELYPYVDKFSWPLSRSLLVFMRATTDTKNNAMDVARILVFHAKSEVISEVAIGEFENKGWKIFSGKQKAEYRTKTNVIKDSEWTGFTITEVKNSSGIYLSLGNYQMNSEFLSIPILSGCSSFFFDTVKKGNDGKDRFLWYIPDMYEQCVYFETMTTYRSTHPFFYLQRDQKILFSLTRISSEWRGETVPGAGGITMYMDDTAATRSQVTFKFIVGITEDSINVEFSYKNTDKFEATDKIKKYGDFPKGSRVPLWFMLEEDTGIIHLGYGQEEDAFFIYAHPIPLPFKFIVFHAAYLGGLVNWTIGCHPDVEVIDGGWTEWSSWSCSVTCGGGYGVRKRSCTNPKPNAYGKPCSGSSTESNFCNSLPCGHVPSVLTSSYRSSLVERSKFIRAKCGEEVRFSCTNSLLGELLDYKESLTLGVYKESVLLGRSGYNEDNREYTISNVTLQDAGVYSCAVKLTDFETTATAVYSLEVASCGCFTLVSSFQTLPLLCYSELLKDIYNGTEVKWYLHNMLYLNYTTDSKHVFEIENSLYLNASHTGNWMCEVKDIDMNKVITRNYFCVDVVTTFEYIRKNWKKILFDDKDAAASFIKEHYWILFVILLFGFIWLLKTCVQRFHLWKEKNSYANYN